MEPEARRLLDQRDAVTRLARQFDDCPLLHLDTVAGPDTWSGPLADSFRADLTAYQQRLGAAAEDLRQRARRLDRRAADVEAAALRRAL